MSVRLLKPFTVQHKKQEIYVWNRELGRDRKSC